VHACHAQIARRANLSQSVGIAVTPKSAADFAASHPNGQNQVVKETPEQIVAQLNGGAAQAVGLAGPMNAPM
jgi:hypothetical protein